MKDFKSLPRKSQDRRPHHSSRQETSTRFVIGRNPVLELLKREEGRKRAIKALIQAREKGADTRGTDIYNEIKKLNIPIKEVGRDELTNMCGSEGHQGVALEVKERPLLDLRQLIELAGTFEKGLFLALDSITDPQNVGAILRAAECLGVKAVFWSHNRSSGITPTVSKVSAGASEMMTLASVSNLRDALEKLKKEGFWSVAAVISDDAQKLHTFSFPDKTCLILGSEGGGVGPLMAKEADFRVYIQQYGAIDSLNVSQASAVFLAEFARQKLSSS